MVVSFYVYVDIASPEEHVTWQRSMAASHKLLGRVVVASEGCNGAVSGLERSLRSYEVSLEATLGARIDFKRSRLGHSCRRPFPDFHAKKSREIVSMCVGSSEMAGVEEGRRVSAAEFRTCLLAGDVIVIDVRNCFEHAVGYFEGSIRPPIRTASDFGRWLDASLGAFEGKNVWTYCTGGVRCEKATKLLRSRGCCDVAQLEGGIHRFLEAFPDGGGVWRGRNFVFDAREINPPPTTDVVGRCSHCGAPWDVHAARHVCSVCEQLALVCPDCSATEHEHYCDNHASLRGAYCHFLDRHDDSALADQMRRLEDELASSTRAAASVNVRRALRKQLARVEDRRDLLRKRGIALYEGPPRCRSCGSTVCVGCWGFWIPPPPEM